ncbi:MAG TPA: hypothetical protein VJH23_03295 [archaeon]|nr:hypothetical protein [archaeon]
MDEEVPRRMRRFYRGEKPTEEEVKHESAQIAISEVDRFRETQGRYPARNELDEISQNVFDQLKRELAIADAEEKEKSTAQEKWAKQAKDGKSFLELRRQKHVAAKTEEKAAKGTANGKKKITEEEETPIGGPEEYGEEAEGQEPSGEMEVDSEEISDDKNVQKLAEMDEVSGLEKELSDDDSDLVERKIDSDLNVCPRCGNRADELIYCPSCGEAFCDHCAKAVEAQGDSVKYTCPKCMNVFKKSKSRM